MKLRITSRQSTTAPSEPGLLSTDGNRVIALYWDPLRAEEVARVEIKSNEFLTVPAMSGDGRYLCVQVDAEIGSGISGMRMILLRREDSDWKVVFESAGDKYRGVPFFACADRYLVYGVGCIDAQAVPTNYGECKILDLRLEKNVPAPVQYVDAYRPEVPMGSSVDEHRFLLAKWGVGGRREIVMCDMRDNSARFLRTGWMPVKVDEKDFVFLESGDTYVAAFDAPQKAWRLLKKATPHTSVPGTRHVVLARAVQDSLFSGTATDTLWRLNVDLGPRESLLKDRKLLKQDEFGRYGGAGCFSWYVVPRKP